QLADDLVFLVELRQSPCEGAPLVGLDHPVTLVAAGRPAQERRIGVSLGECSCDPRAIVVGAVVDEQEAIGRTALFADRPQQLAEVALLVEERDDYREPHAGSSIGCAGEAALAKLHGATRRRTRLRVSRAT